MKPRLTGYPNVYEYELNNNVIVRVDDILTISWHGNVSQPDQVRFSLAYYINNGFSVPMVSVVVDDCDDLLTSNALHCTSHVTRNVTITPATNGRTTSTSTTTNAGNDITPTQANTNQANESDSEIQLSTTNETIIISGVVVFSLVLLIILLIFLIVFTFVVKRRRKSASMNATDPIEMSNQLQMLHNTPNKSSIDSNQVYTTREEAEHDEIVDCMH
jgi:flagellar biosynthesis/type III secretory pathway M-ring protein FliF/YscJ